MTTYNDPDLTDAHVDALASEMTTSLFAQATKLERGERLTSTLPCPPYLQGLRVQCTVECAPRAQLGWTWRVQTCLLPSARNATSPPACISYALLDTDYEQFETHVRPAVKEMLLAGDRQVPGQALADAIRASGLQIRTREGRAFESAFANKCLDLACRPVFSVMPAEKAVELLAWVRDWCADHQIKFVAVQPDATDAMGSYAVEAPEANAFTFDEAPDSSDPPPEEPGDAFDL